jgi:hypothetical protein
MTRQVLSIALMVMMAVKKGFKGTCFVCEKLRRQIIFNECLNKSDIKK